MDKRRKLIDEWEMSDSEERKDFLVDLDRKYKFERLCSALSKNVDKIMCKRNGGTGLEELLQSSERIIFRLEILRRISILQNESRGDGHNQ